MPHEISDNQRRLMAAIERPGTVSTRELGDVKGASGLPLTADIARKTLWRLERRGFITGDGRGLSRRWWLTSAGEVQLGRNGGAKQDWTRPYVVLERITVDELHKRLQWVGEVYVEVAVVDARNTDHAYKQASVGYAEDLDTTMVAIATRNFQPQPVHITNKQAVSVG